MHLVLYGGSFDPPHIAHTEIIKEVLECVKLDLLVIMVAYHNPLKSPCIFSEKLRLRWMKEICNQWKKVVVSDFEINHKITYTIKTVEFLQKKFQPKNISVILGEDNFLVLHRWYKIKELQEKVKFILVRRKGFEYNTRDLVHQEIHLRDIVVPISSTQIRDGRGILNKELIPPMILQDVVEHFKEIEFEQTKN